MNKQVLRDFITTRPALQELLKEGTTSINLSKNIPNSKEHQHNEEFTSTNGQNSQLTSNGNNFKFKLTKSPNQKIQPKPIHMLYPDPSYMQGYTKTQNKGMEKDLPTKWRAKINK